MIGAYGLWAAEKALGKGPPRLSFRTGKWKTLDPWRRVARQRVRECLAPVDMGGVPKVRLEAQGVYDGLHFERLSWQLPMGPRTEAVFLKPARASGPLPGILGLHDHSGQKYLGWRKIARDGGQTWQAQVEHQQGCYGGVPWANEAAKRGYAVLVHDTFPFASRRVRVSDVLPPVQHGGVDPAPDDLEGVRKYNEFAGRHEDIMAKSLFCAGTTWPGQAFAEDCKALDILCARPDVDARRVGCGGLSGGGTRTAYLAGLDDRIRCAVCAGFMTTWRDFILDKCFTHTWMIYAPLLPRDLDFPEILALRAPLPSLVLNNLDDSLFTIREMRRADRIIAQTYRLGGAPERYQCRYYAGPHKFDLPMQQDACAWFDRYLK